MERIHKILSDNWAMRRQEFENLAAVLLPSIASGNLEAAGKAIDTKKLKPMAVKYTGDDIATVTWIDYLWENEIPEGSVMLIKLSGALYSWETKWLIEQIKTAERDKRICGIVLEIDGPGGMSSHVERAAGIIRNCKKPIATVVTDLMASAHFWLGTASDRIFAASPLCEMGGVGAFITHISFKEYFKKNGIDYRSIYPDTADLKNKEHRALEDKGDESLFKEALEHLHKAFSNDVAVQLGITYDPELPLFRGEMFYTSEAISLGIVDEMGEVEDAVKWVQLQSQIQEANSFYSSNK